MAQPCGLVLIRQHSVVMTSGCADQLAMPTASRCCVGNSPTNEPSARIHSGQDTATSCRSPRCHIADVRGGDAELASRRADYVLKSVPIRTSFGAQK